MDCHEHLLTCLMEECAEVQQACAKALRFGVNDRDPFKPDAKTNRELIAEEMGDVYAVMQMLWKRDIVPDAPGEAAIARKQQKVLAMMKWSVERGTLPVLPS